MMITIPGEGVGKRIKGKYALFPFIISLPMEKNRKRNRQY